MERDGELERARERVGVLERERVIQKGSREG
jgi:hypothetical protein